jgi:hypothetical protein
VRVTVTFYLTTAQEDHTASLVVTPPQEHITEFFRREAGAISEYIYKKIANKQTPRLIMDTVQPEISLILCDLVELFCQEPRGEEEYIRVAGLIP